MAAIVGLSAVWSLEAFAYTRRRTRRWPCAQAWLAPRPGPAAQPRCAAPLEAVLACVVAHVVFAAARRSPASGRCPDWGEYLAYLRAFLFGEVGDLTYDIPRWSPGLAVGAGYLASAAALAELARRRHGRRATRAARVIALDRA